MRDDGQAGYSRAQLMDLANFFKDAPGFDMLVSLPEDERVLDVRIAELHPRVAAEQRGRQQERGVLCSTSTRLLFFQRVAGVETFKELLAATGCLVECRLRRESLDLEVAARTFPKSKTALLELRKKMAALFFPDLLPVLSIPLAGIAAIMGFYDSSEMANLDIEVDLRSDFSRLRRLIPSNPQLRLILGSRLAQKPYLEPERSLPLVSACPQAELVDLIELIRDAQAELGPQRERLFPEPLAIWLLATTPRPKVSLVLKGERMAGAIGIDQGVCALYRKLVMRDVLFNVGEVDDVHWDEDALAMVVKGPSFNYRLQAEKDSVEFACLRSYLTELVEARRRVWEPPTPVDSLAPDSKPEPIGELLRYHLEPCNDPQVFLANAIPHELVDQFMDGFGQVIASSETPRGLVLLSKSVPHHEGLLFTESAVYARKAGQPGGRIGYEKLDGLVEAKKGFRSSSLILGNQAFKLDVLGKETVKALGELLRSIPRHAG